MFKTLLDMLYKYLVGRIMGPQPKDPKAISGGITMSLGSGYSTEDDMRRRVNALREIGYHLITDPSFIKRDITGDGLDETFCNVAVRYAAEKLCCFDFNPMMNANAMVNDMEHGYSWIKESPERAADHAMRGGLSVAGKVYEGHGHVAIIAPEPCQMSGSWGHKVPMVFNVGKKNGIMKTSEAFPVGKGEPSYYVWSGAE